jgi:hypothetical protein
MKFFKFLFSREKKKSKEKNKSDDSYDDRNRDNDDSSNKIKISELIAWIDSFREKALKDFRYDFSDINDAVENEKEKLIENIETLKNAELKNNKIPEREKQLMEGNRKIYLHKVERFLSEMDIPEDASRISEFCNRFNKLLDEFGESTVKNYYVLQQFFGNESERIAGNMHVISKNINKAKVLFEKSGIGDIDILKTKASELIKIIESKTAIEKDIARDKEEFKRLKKVIAEKEDSITKYENDAAYREYLNLLDEEKNIGKDISELNKELVHRFSVIDDALKKYEHVSENSKLIKKYLENSLDALIEDKDRKIYGIILGMKESVKNNEISLKEKAREKILSELEGMDKIYFGNFIEKYNVLIEKRARMIHEINNSEIMKKISEAKEELKDEARKKDALEKTISETELRLERFDVDAQKIKLETDIKKILDEEVKMIID